jgi:branched-chain amino acid aminotransferase
MRRKSSKGLKAYKQADGVALFRPEANAAASTRARCVWPCPIPEELCRGGEADWCWPTRMDPGSGRRLAVSAPLHDRHRGVPWRAPGQAVQVHRHRQPGGNYFKSGSPAVSIWVSQYTRGAGRRAARPSAAATMPPAGPSGRGDGAGPRSGVFLDAAEAQVDRGTGRHEPVLRV